MTIWGTTTVTKGPCPVHPAVLLYHLHPLPLLSSSSCQAFSLLLLSLFRANSSCQALSLLLLSPSSVLLSPSSEQTHLAWRSPSCFSPSCERTHPGCQKSSDNARSILVEERPVDPSHGGHQALQVIMVNRPMLYDPIHLIRRGQGCMAEEVRQLPHVHGGNAMFRNDAAVRHGVDD